MNIALEQKKEMFTSTMFTQKAKKATFFITQYSTGGQKVDNIKRKTN